MSKNQIISIIILAVLVIGLFIYYINTKTSDSNNIEIINQENNTENSQNTQEKLEETQKEIINNNQQKTMKAKFTTSEGSFTIELFPNLAPKTVENFAKLSKEGFYNGTKFHRVIEGFMNQAGDPLTKDDSMESRWGTGGPGYQFADEIHAENRNVTGTLSMANAGPNTNGSQFFINTADNNFLDTKHTVFGKVIEGMDIVLKINKTNTDQYDRPVNPIIINSIEII